MTSESDKPEKEYEFLIVCDDDDLKFGLNLEKEIKEEFTCDTSWAEPEGKKSNIGRLLIDIAEEKIKTADSVLFIFSTQNTCILTLILKLLESKHLDEFRFVLLTYQPNKERELKDLLKVHSLLAEAPYRHIDFNSESWASNIRDYLKSVFKGKISDLLPAGCLSHSQVFSYFVGYLSHVLPKLADKLRETSIFGENGGRVSDKLYVLLPTTPHPSMKIETEKVVKVSSVVIEACHAGKNRRYEIPIFSIKKGDQELYFMVDIPTVLFAIQTMAEWQGQINLQFQMTRFYNILEMIINHKALTSPLKDTVKLLVFDDEKGRREDMLFNVIQEDLNRSSTETDGPLASMRYRPSALMQDEDPCEHFCCILSTDDSSEDAKCHHEIRTFLEDNSKKICRNEGRNIFQIMSISKWHIILVSKQTLKNKLDLFCTKVSVTQDRLVRTILVLIDIELQEVPASLKWVYVLNRGEPKFCEKLLSHMEGNPVSIENRVPIGDLATGLAWAYVINYLGLTLQKNHNKRDVSERIQKFLIENDRAGVCFNRFYSVAPKSCTTHEELHEFANKEHKGEENLSYIHVKKPDGKKEDVLEPCKIGPRFYRLRLFKYTDKNGKSVYFVCEYNTPVNCLHDMANKLAGLSFLLKEDMYEQCKKLDQEIPKVLKSPTVKEKIGDLSHLVRIVHYDDESGQTSLIRALQKQFKEDAAAADGLIYADAVTDTGDAQSDLPDFGD